MGHLPTRNGRLRFSLYRRLYVALLCLKVPVETARLFSSIEVPGKKNEIDSMHVSLVYMGKELEIEAILLAIQVTYQVLANWYPFQVTTRWVSTFQGDPDGTKPVICRVESTDLHELQAALKEAFEEEGVPFSNKWPSFKPHVTLSYTKRDVPDFIIPAISWTASEVVLWGGDEGESDLIVRFPLALMNQRAASAERHSLRPYIKTALWFEKQGCQL